MAQAMPSRLGEKGYRCNRNGEVDLPLVEAGQHREEGAGGESGTQQQGDGTDGGDAGGAPGEAQGGGGDKADESGDDKIVVFHSGSPFCGCGNLFVAFLVIVWYHEEKHL